MCWFFEIDVTEHEYYGYFHAKNIVLRYFWPKISDNLSFSRSILQNVCETDTRLQKRERERERERERNQNQNPYQYRKTKENAKIIGYSVLESEKSTRHLSKSRTRTRKIPFLSKILFHSVTKQLAARRAFSSSSRKAVIPEGLLYVWRVHTILQVVKRGFFNSFDKLGSTWIRLPFVSRCSPTPYKSDASFMSPTEIWLALRQERRRIKES